MNILNLPITTAIAVTATDPANVLKLAAAPRNLVVQANFTYGSGGTTVDAYLQTSLDNCVTWTDIAQFHFTTASGRPVVNLNGQTPVTTQLAPGDGALTANTAIDGVLGACFRVKYKSTGTYAGTNLSIDVQSDQLK